MTLLFEAAWHLGHAPWWLGWTLLFAGAFALGLTIGSLR